MKSKCTAALPLLAALAIALPAAAEVDPKFMKEMARTDGNPQGDYAIPTISSLTRSRIEQAEHDAFLRELARADGGQVEPVASAPSDTTVARR